MQEEPSASEPVNYKDEVDKCHIPRGNYVYCMLFHVEKVTQHVSNTIGVSFELLDVDYSEYLQAHADHENCIYFIVILLLVESWEATVDVENKDGPVCQKGRNEVLS